MNKKTVDTFVFLCFKQYQLVTTILFFVITFDQKCSTNTKNMVTG